MSGAFIPEWFLSSPVLTAIMVAAVLAVGFAAMVWAMVLLVRQARKDWR